MMPLTSAPTLFISELKKKVGQDVLPWLVAALRQAPQVWETLLNSDLGEQALKTMPDKGESWSPAALAFLALSSPAAPGLLASTPMVPLEPGLRNRASRAYEEWQNHPSQALAFPQAGLLALALRERRRVKGAWDGLVDELGVRAVAARTVMACLYGIVPDPMDLLRELVQAKKGGWLADHNFYANLAVQAFLSNPLPPPVQAEQLARLLRELAIDQRLILLRLVAQQRPILASQAVPAVTSQAIPGGQVTSVPEEAASLSGWSSISGQIDRLAQLYQAGEISSIARQASEAIPILSEAYQVARLLAGSLAVRLAQTATLSADGPRALDAWRQAILLVPDSMSCRAEAAITFLDQNRATEAASLLFDRPVSGATSTPPEYHLAKALLAAHSGDSEAARQSALAALEGLQPVQLRDHAASNPGVSTVVEERESSTLAAFHQLSFNFNRLAQVLLDLNLPFEAGRCIETGLAQNPDDAHLLALQAQVYLATGNAAATLPLVYAAQALNANLPGLDRLLVECLEAAGEWKVALQERLTWLESSVNQPEGSQLITLRELAYCAIQAEDYPTALQACEQAISLDPNDGAAYELLGDACLKSSHLPLVDRQTLALDNYQQATLLAPHLPGPWLKLAQLSQDRNQPENEPAIFKQNMRLEILRTASQAAPLAPEIHLALGEAYLDENALTQALACLRRAAALADTAQFQETLSHNPGLRQLKATKLIAQIALPLGSTLRRLGHNSEACQVLERAYDEIRASGLFDPQVAYAYAQSLLAQDELYKALALLEVVISSQPADPAPYLDYAHTLLKVSAQPQQDAEQLAPLLLAVLEFPELPALTKAEAQALLAETYHVTGELLKAKDAYQKALETPLAQQPNWKVRLSIGLGRVALALGHYETAIAALREASHLEPGNLVVQHALAEASLGSGLLDDALLSARVVLHLAPTDVETLSWYAGLSHQVFKLSGEKQSEARVEALNALQKAVLIDPQRTDLLIKLGDLQMESGDRIAAIRTFKRLVPELSDAGLAEIVSGDEETAQRSSQSMKVSLQDLFIGAQRLRQLGDPASAVLLLENALTQHNAVHSSDPEAGRVSLLVVDIYLELAQAHIQLGNARAGLSSLDKAILLAPDNPNLYQQKADLLIDMGQRIQALNCFEQALRLEPTNAALLLRTAGLLYTTGKLPEALEHASLAASASHAADQYTVNLSARLLAAYLARVLLRPQLAVKLLEMDSCINQPVDPADLAEYNCLSAELALENGNTERAAEALGNAIKGIARRPRLLAVQARLIAQQGDFTAGISLLQAALQTPVEVASGKETPVRYISTLRALGEAAVDLGQWEEALRHFQQAANIVPQEPLAQLELAQALVQRAEVQRLYSDLNIVHSAPGENALGEQAFEAFRAAMTACAAASSGMANAPTQPEELRPRKRKDNTSALLQDKGAAMVARWNARGRAIFRPSPQNVLDFQTWLDEETQWLENARSEQCAAEETASLLMASRACKASPGDGNYSNPDYQAFSLHPAFSEHTRKHSQDPLVMLQLALSQAANVLPDQANIKQAIETGNHAMALQAIRPYRRLPLTPLLYALLANLYHQSGDPVSALQSIQSALDIWPNEPRWHVLAADVHLSIGHIEPSKEPALEVNAYANDQAALLAAIDHLEKAIRLESKYAPHYLAIGELYQTLGDYSQAVRALEQATRILPEHAGAWLSLSRAQLATGALEKAAYSAEQAIKFAPDDPQPLLLRADIALRQNIPLEAQERIQAVMRLQPDSPVAILLQARCQYALSHQAEALTTIEKAIRLAEDPLPLELERIDWLRHYQGTASALAALEELGLCYPREARVQALLAETYLETGRAVDANQSARLALQSNHGELAAETEANLHHLIGWQMRRSGQLDQAIYHLAQAVQLNPTNLENYLELGQTHQDRRQYAQALAVYQQAMQVSGRDYRPYYLAGITLKESKDYAAAESMLHRAADLAPQEVSVHRLLAAVVAMNLVHNRHSIPTP